MALAAEIFLVVSISLIVMYVIHAIKTLWRLNSACGCQKWFKDLLTEIILKSSIERSRPLALVIEMMHNRLNAVEQNNQNGHGKTTGKEPSVERDRSLALIIEIMHNRLSILEQNNQNGQSKTTGNKSSVERDRSLALVIKMMHNRLSAVEQNNQNGHDGCTTETDTQRKLEKMEYQYSLLAENMNELKLKNKRIMDRINNQRTTVHYDNSYNHRLPNEYQYSEPEGNCWTARPGSLPPYNISVPQPPAQTQLSYPADMHILSSQNPAETSTPFVQYSSPPPYPETLPPRPPPPTTPPQLLPPFLSFETNDYKRIKITSELLKTVKLKPVQNRAPS